MESIILQFTGYTVQGSALITDFKNNSVGVEVHSFYLDRTEFNEESIDMSKGIHAPYLAVENATLEIYQTYQANIKQNIVFCNVWIKTISI